ncbi:DUF4224 domain-containing protein [Nitrosomonas sp. HPC101]|uniref:DUF4224 domain-containing protein n=1 Tax=Nitrosomonas sp. HPC101 TaxID=1658667 RepID=UPI00136CF106|nr:DUF4224 domain-containing protein [Nitrosomonas sp. HPC101]MXS85323.1 DUF4224 domain-containing protein [Nitrosomonas sp. HPC101]
MSIFLEPADVAELTGRRLKSAQVKQLRTMGILFYLNASGRPIVPKSAVEGRKEDAFVRQKWQPNGI